MISPSSDERKRTHIIAFGHHVAIPVYDNQVAKLVAANRIVLVLVLYQQTQIVSVYEAVTDRVTWNEALEQAQQYLTTMGDWPF